MKTLLVILCLFSLKSHAAFFGKPFWNKQGITLAGGDITNGYIDLARLCIASSLSFLYGGLSYEENVDYTTSEVGGVTRVTFSGDLAVGGASELIAGNRVYIQCQYNGAP